MALPPRDVVSDTAVVAAEGPRRYDPPHILWYFGAVTAAATASATVVSVSPGARGTYQLLVGILFTGAFAAGALQLLAAAGACRAACSSSPPLRWCRRSARRSSG